MSKRTKQVSKRQLEANRRNAKKSTGPKTQTGIDISKFNALRHGLTANIVCIPGEHRPDYDARRKEYHDLFQPANIAECELVDDLVSARWRKQRIIKHESTLIKIEVERRRIENADPTITDTTPDVDSTLATQALAESGDFLRLLDRYETRFNHNIARTLKLLLELQRNRPPAGGPAPVYPPTENTWPESTPDVSPSPVSPAPTSVQTIDKPSLDPQSEPTPAPENTSSPNEANPTNGHPAIRPVLHFRVIAPQAAESAIPNNQPAENTPVTNSPELFRTAASSC